MDNIYVVTPSAVHPLELRKLVEELGGYWNEEPSLDQGVLEKRKAWVFISLAPNFRSEYDPEDLAAVRSALGGEPESAIDIHIGHGTGSRDLAEEFARTLIDHWGGVIDRDS